MAGKYVRKMTANGEWMFNLKAANGEVILTSQRYSSAAARDNGINSVQVNSPLDARYDRRVSKADEPYFALTAANGQDIGVSEMYSSNQARDKGIESVKVNGPTTVIEDE